MCFRHNENVCKLCSALNCLSHNELHDEAQRQQQGAAGAGGISSRVTRSHSRSFWACACPARARTRQAGWFHACASCGASVRGGAVLQFQLATRARVWRRIARGKGLKNARAVHESCQVSPSPLLAQSHQCCVTHIGRQPAAEDQGRQAVRCCLLSPGGWDENRATAIEPSCHSDGGQLVVALESVGTAGVRLWPQTASRVGRFFLTTLSLCR